MRILVITSFIVVFLVCSFRIYTNITESVKLRETIQYNNKQIQKLHESIDKLLTTEVKTDYDIRLRQIEVFDAEKSIRDKSNVTII